MALLVCCGARAMPFCHTITRSRDMRSLFPLAHLQNTLIKRCGRQVSLVWARGHLWWPERLLFSLTPGFKACLCLCTRLGSGAFMYLVLPPYCCSWISFQTNCLKNACAVNGNYLTRATYGWVDDLWYIVIGQATPVHYPSFGFSPVLAHLKPAARHVAVGDLLISGVKD